MAQSQYRKKFPAAAAAAPQCENWGATKTSFGDYCIMYIVQVPARPLFSRLTRWLEVRAACMHASVRASRQARVLMASAWRSRIGLAPVTSSTIRPFQYNLQVRWGKGCTRLGLCQPSEYHLFFVFHKMISRGEGEAARVEVGSWSSCRGS